MFSQNNKMEPNQATEIVRLKKIKGNVAKLYPILENWETTGTIIYHRHALHLLKFRQTSNSGPEAREENMKAGEIKEATEANEKLENDLVKAYRFISTFCQKLAFVEQENKTVA
ncbi:unnamed protein product [Caenorhabditis brenneri]